MNYFWSERNFSYERLFPRLTSWNVFNWKITCISDAFCPILISVKIMTLWWQFWSEEKYFRPSPLGCFRLKNHLYLNCILSYLNFCQNNKFMETFRSSWQILKTRKILLSKNIPKPPPVSYTHLTLPTIYSV